MTKKFKIIAIGFCILVSGAITLVNYKNNQDLLTEKLACYTQGKAIVEKVYPGRVTKRGSTQNRYDLLVTLADGSSITMRQKKLSASLKTGQQITILYNPKDMENEIYLK